MPLNLLEVSETTAPGRTKTKKLKQNVVHLLESHPDEQVFLGAAGVGRCCFGDGNEKLLGRGYDKINRKTLF